MTVALKTPSRTTLQAAAAEFPDIAWELKTIFQSWNEIIFKEQIKDWGGGAGES